LVVGKAQKIGGNQDLPITIRASPNANNRDGQLPPQSTGQWGWHMLQHQGKASLLLQVQGFLP